VIPFLHLGPLTIPTYGLMVATGMLVAYFVLRADLSRRGISAKDSGDAESLIAWPCLTGIVTSKIYSALESPHEFFADPKGVLLSQMGFTWIGGALGGAIVFGWIAMRIIRRANIPGVGFLTFMDMGATAAAIGYGFGRMGCLLSGDGDYGTPTTLPWGMSFPNGLVPTTDRVHPTPIYEFIGACVIAYILWKMGSSFAQPRDTKSHSSQRAASIAARYQPGQIFAAYLVLTGIARFLVEFIRINPRVLWGLTNAQIASLLCILAGTALWFHLQSRRAPHPART
jgi:phosphatidylglycerol---prolipoprotein diacylglyceryl transferase